MARYDKVKPAVLKSKDHPVQKFSEDVRKALEQIHKVLDFTTNKDSFTVDGDIYCNSLHTAPTSIYVGGVKISIEKKMNKPILKIGDIPIDVTQLAQGSGQVGNIDGGSPDADYGGLESIDCGGV